VLRIHWLDKEAKCKYLKYLRGQEKEIEKEKEKEKEKENLSALCRV
jgi:hypothetical protein